MKICEIFARVSTLQYFVVHLLSCHDKTVLEWRKEKRCIDVVSFFNLRTGVIL